MKSFSFILPVMMICILSCSKPPSAPLQALDAIKGLFAAQKYDEAAEHFTGGTRSAAEDLERISPGARQAGYGVAVLFAGGSEWEVIGSDVKGSEAVIRVRYSRHPVENFKGNEMAFRLRNEGGRWKWDMEREIEESVKALRGVPAEPGK